MKLPIFILTPAGTLDGGFVIVAAETEAQAVQLANLQLAPVRFFEGIAVDRVPTAVSDNAGGPCVLYNAIHEL